MQKQQMLHQIKKSDLINHWISRIQKQKNWTGKEQMKCTHIFKNINF